MIRPPGKIGLALFSPEATEFGLLLEEKIQ